MIYLQLFFEFFKTGLFSVGGGLTTLPFLYEMADKYPWFTRAELTEMIAVSESTPGPMGINMATYVGMKTGGVPGGILASLAVILPGFFIVLIISKMMQSFQQNLLVENVFSGLRPAVAGMIAFAGASLLENALLLPGASSFLSSIDWKNGLLFLAMLFAVFKWKKHPIVYIGSAALIGIVFQF